MGSDLLQEKAKRFAIAVGEGDEGATQLALEFAEAVADHCEPINRLVIAVMAVARSRFAVPWSWWTWWCRRRPPTTKSATSRVQIRGTSTTWEVRHRARPNRSYVSKTEADGLNVVTTGTNHQAVSAPEFSKMSPPAPPVPAPFAVLGNSGNGGLTQPSSAGGAPILCEKSTIDRDPPANMPSKPTGGDIQTFAVKDKINVSSGSATMVLSGRGAARTGDTVAVNVIPAGVEGSTRNLGGRRTAPLGATRIANMSGTPKLSIRSTPVRESSDASQWHMRCLAESVRRRLTK